MSNEQLLEIIKIQAEIIRILGKEYIDLKRYPLITKPMIELLDKLNESL